MPTYRDPENSARYYDLERVTHRHEAIMLWLLQNPDQTLGDCARAFNYTQCYLSLMINSGAFRDRFMEFREEHTGTAIATLAEKLEAIADVSLDKLMNQMDEIDDPGFLRDTALKALDRLGYGKNKTTVHVHPGAGSVTQIGVVNRGMLAQARARRETMQLHLQQKEAEAETNALEGEFVEISDGKD